ncbi:hypothetical protein SGPA1_11278 [Streptomyces misionensis JCM 4497]
MPWPGCSRTRPARSARPCWTSAIWPESATSTRASCASCSASPPGCRSARCPRTAPRSCRASPSGCWRPTATARSARPPGCATTTCSSTAARPAPVCAATRRSVWPTRATAPRTAPPTGAPPARRAPPRPRTRPSAGASATAVPPPDRPSPVAHRPATGDRRPATGDRRRYTGHRSQPTERPHPNEFTHEITQTPRPVHAPHPPNETVPALREPLPAPGRPAQPDRMHYGPDISPERDPATPASVTPSSASPSPFVPLTPVSPARQAVAQRPESSAPAARPLGAQCTGSTLSPHPPAATAASRTPAPCPRASRSTAHHHTAPHPSATVRRTVRPVMPATTFRRTPRPAVPARAPGASGARGRGAGPPARPVPGPEPHRQSLRVLRLEHPVVLLQVRGDPDENVLGDRVRLGRGPHPLPHPADHRPECVHHRADRVPVLDPARRGGLDAAAGGHRGGTAVGRDAQRRGALGHRVGVGAGGGDDLVQLEVDRPEAGPDDVPVDLLAGQGQVHQIDQGALQRLGHGLQVRVGQRALHDVHPLPPAVGRP